MKTILGTVLSQHHELYSVLCEESGREMRARVAGKLAHRLRSAADFPVVGDRVALDRDEDIQGDAVILEILPRRSLLLRTAAGPKRYSQPIAANLDVLFICTSLNQELRQRRLERYLAAARGAGIAPVIVLTKADLCAEAGARRAQVAQGNPGVQILCCSAKDGADVRQVRACIGKGQAAFVGSSGVGKSTLLNALIGEDALRTSAVREEDARGRHTTTHRQLVRLPGGGAVIDTPGMREFALDESDVDAAFEDIEALAASCRFADCAHGQEPGCAVRRAVESGAIERGRYENYLKLRREEERRGRRGREKRR